MMKIPEDLVLDFSTVPLKKKLKEKVKDAVKKHLAGKHNQADHGHRHDFDGQAEWSRIFEGPFNTASKIREGVKREEAEKYFKRQDVIKAAERFAYAGNKSAKSEVDEIFSKKIVKIKRLKNKIEIEAEGGVFYDLRHKQAMDYARLLMGDPEFQYS
jgi:hypothetical protein